MAITETLHRNDKVRSGIALGGIGAGSVELRKDACFYNWWIFNNEPFGSGDQHPFEEDSMLFFLVRYQEKGGTPKIKLLQIDEGDLVAAIPNHYYTFPWLTGVECAKSEMCFPVARFTFTDPQMPFVVGMEAMSSFIPHDVKNSSLPAIFFNFTVTSTTNKPVDVMLLGSMRNAVGYDTPDRAYKTKIHRKPGYLVCEMSCDGMDKKHSTYGTMALASASSDSTYYAGWEHRHPYYEIVIRSTKLPNIDDTAGRNSKDEKTGKVTAGARLFSTVGKSKRLLKRGASLQHEFVASWHFPNLYAGMTAKDKRQGKKKAKRFEGHYYDKFFKNATEVAEYAVKRRTTLCGQTVAFQAAMFDNTLPDYVTEQVSSNLNTFFTSSWLTKSGDFGIQEGITRAQSWGPLATIDVALYGSISTAALFPELDKSMFRAHIRLQQKSGEIAHGIGRNFGTPDINEHVKGRLDLPSQFVTMALRGYFWTGDKSYLKEIWPAVTKALEYVLRERDMNGDLLPDMEGAMCTYDNFPMFGAASFVAGIWLAALRYAVDAAKVLGRKDEARRYAEILEKATKVYEDKLWNGEYYLLYNDEGGPKGDKDEGCLSDQIIGQWTMHHVGFEDLLKKTRIRKALRKIMELSYQPEYGLVNCRWPEDEFFHEVPESCWSDQANTCWTGVELAFASFLIYEGMVKDGLKIVKRIDDRYRDFGMYWDHQEWGGHYYRPMSAWMILNAVLGLSINGNSYTFKPRVNDKNLKLFFAFADGYAHYIRDVIGKKEQIRISVANGKMKVKELDLGLKTKALSKLDVRLNGKAVPKSDYSVEFGKGAATIKFKRVVTVGNLLTIGVQ